MRLTGYQSGPRWQGVRLNIALISNYIDPSVDTAIDIGSNEGIITCALAELGIQAKGYEQSSKYNSRAVRLAEYMKSTATFENRLVSEADVGAMDNLGAIMFLSVHHQIAAHNSLEAANEFLIALARKTKHQLFFQPACIQAKYKCVVPFADNDYAAVVEYFNDVLKDEMPYATMIGFAQNDMPKSEPLRPMIVYSREPTVLQHNRDTAGVLKKIGTSVDKVHTAGSALLDLAGRFKK